MPARDLSAGVTARLGDRVVYPAMLYEGTFYSGGAEVLVNAWTGFGALSWNGKTWLGQGNLLGVSSIEESTDIRAIGFDVTLTGVKSSNISLALQSGRQGKPGKIWLALFEPNYVDFDFTRGTIEAQVGAGVATLDVTRAGATATRVNASGQIETVAANTARLDYDPATLACEGILVEEARTNLVENGDAEGDLLGWGANNSANARSQAHVICGAWAVKNTTTNAAGAGPYFRKRDGSLMAVTGSKDYSFSLWVYAEPAAVGKTYQPKIEWNDAGGASVGTAVGSVVALAAGWQRVTLTATSPATAAKCTPVFYTSAAQGVFDIYVDAVQFELGSVPTSVIRTTTGAVSRAVDVPLVAAGSWMNEAAFSIYYEFMRPVLPVTGGTTAMIIARSNNARAGYITSGSAVLNSYDGANIAGVSGNIAAGAICRAAFALDANGMALSRDGSAVAASAFDGSFDSGQAFGIGCNNAGTGSLNGYIRRVMFVPRRLSDAELQALSASSPGRLAGMDMRLADEPYQLRRGKLNVMRIQDAGPDARISVMYEGVLAGLSVARERRYTNYDQQIDYPGDRGFEFVPGLQDALIPWGRASS